MSGYNLFSLNFSAQELLYLLQDKNEPEEPAGLMTTLINNVNTTEIQKVNVNIINHFVNTFIRLYRGEGTYKDYLYIDSFLQKAGISKPDNYNKLVSVYIRNIENKLRLDNVYSTIVDNDLQLKLENHIGRNTADMVNADKSFNNRYMQYLKAMKENSEFIMQLHSINVDKQDMRAEYVKNSILLSLSEAGNISEGNTTHKTEINDNDLHAANISADMYINPFISLEKDIKNGNASEENYIMGETERTLAAVICEIIKQVYKRGLRTCIDIDKRNEHTNIYTGENSSSYNHTYRTENFYADNVKDDFYGLTGEVLEKLQRDYAYVQNYKDYVKQGHVNSSFTDNVRNYEVNIGSVDIESAGMMEHIAANIGNEDIESMGSIERRESYVENAGIMEHRKADAENADTMEHREADAENADIIKHSENNIENINIPEHREVNIDSADKVFSNVTEYNSNNENTDIVEYREANVENMNIMEQSIADIVHEDFTEHRVADTAHEDFTEHCGADIVNIDTADAAYNSMDEHGTDIENVTAHQSITGAAAILDTDINYTDNTTNVAADMHILNMNVLNTAAINGHTENEKSVNNVLGGYTENKNTENKNTENNVLNRYVENRYTENKNTENINKVNRNITDEIIVHKNTENSNIENEYTVSADIENAVYDDALTFNKYLDITESFILNELRRRKNIRIIDNSVDTNAIDSDTINENADRDNVNSGNTAQYDEKNINTANDISISSGVNQNEEMTLLHIDNKEELQRLEELLSYEFGGVNNLSKLEKNNVTDSRIISGKPINNSVTENNITEKSFTENSIAESSITENSISEHKVIENNPAVIDLKTTYEAEQSESVNENTIRNTIESIHGNINQNRTGNISQSHNIIVPSETKADAEYDEEYIFFTRAVEYLAQSQAMEEYKKSSSGLNAAGTLSTIATMETAYTPDYGNGTAAGREIVTGRIIAAVTETGEQIGAANVELTLPFSQEDTGEISGDGSYRTGQTENRVKTIDNEKLTRIDESSISSAADISNYSYSDGRHGTDSEEYIGRSIGERVNNIIDSRINKISEKVYSQLEHRLENERRRRGR
nr:MAG TPA: hypothetical protein [Caudoviricetes sp.]